MALSRTIWVDLSKNANRFNFIYLHCLLVVECQRDHLMFVYNMNSLLSVLQSQDVALFQWGIEYCIIQSDFQTWVHMYYETAHIFGFVNLFLNVKGDCSGRDYVVIRVTTTWAISAYHH